MFRTDQVFLNERFTRHCEAPRQSLDFLFTKARLHFFAAVGALGAINPRPDASCRRKHKFINLIGLQPALVLQQMAKPVVDAILCGCL